MNDSIWPNLILAIILSATIALFVKRYLFFVAKVSSSSMSPLLRPGQRLLVKPLYAFNKVQRGNIVIFYSLELNQDLIKQVIGLPGDRIDIRENGKVYLNQKQLDEPYVENPGGNSGNFVVPKGKYFMLGTNRVFSQDSRHFKDPYIAHEDIIGKAFLSLNPMHKL